MQQYLALSNDLREAFQQNERSFAGKTANETIQWLEMLATTYNSEINTIDRVSVCVFSYFFGLNDSVLPYLDRRRKDYILEYYGINILENVLELRKLRNVEVRKKFTLNSNNSENPNKNGCVLAVCNYLNVGKRAKYLHTEGDVLRVVRNKYNIKERKDLKNFTLKELESKARKTEYFTFGFIVIVKEHILFLDANGLVVIDTAYKPKNVALRVYELY